MIRIRSRKGSVCFRLKNFCLSPSSIFSNSISLDNRFVFSTSKELSSISTSICNEVSIHFISEIPSIDISKLILLLFLSTSHFFLHAEQIFEFVVVVNGEIYLIQIGLFFVDLFLCDLFHLVFWITPIQMQYFWHFKTVMIKYYRI